MADAAAGAIAPLVLVGALLGVLAAALRKWSAQRPRKANVAGSDHHDFDDNGNDDRPRGG